MMLREISKQVGYSTGLIEIVTNPAGSGGGRPWALHAGLTDQQLDSLREVLLE